MLLNILGAIITGLVLGSKASGFWVRLRSSLAHLQTVSAREDSVVGPRSAEYEEVDMYMIAKKVLLLIISGEV